MTSRSPRTNCVSVENLEVQIVDRNVETMISEPVRRRIEEIWDGAVADRSVDHEADVLLGIDVARDQTGTVIRCIRGRYRHVLAAALVKVPWWGMAVTGIVVVQHLAKMRILCGRRCKHLATFASAYEFPPAGGIEISDLGSDGKVNVVRRFLTELEEETSLPAKAVTRCEPLGIIRSDEICDIVVGATIEPEVVPSDGNLQPTSEYDELRFVNPDKSRRLATEHSVVPTFAPIINQLWPRWCAELSGRMQ